jgi:hypothetical protein
MSLLYRTPEEKQIKQKFQVKQVWKLESEIKKALSGWFVAEYELPQYSANILADHIVPKVIHQWVSKVSASAPEVMITDKSVIENRLMDCKEMALKLDADDQLEKILDAEANMEEYQKHGI